MKKLLLAVPVSLTVEDFQDGKTITNAFNVVFKQLSKKQAKKLTPNRLTELLNEANAIADGKKVATEEEATKIKDELEAIKDEVIETSFKKQVMGEDSKKLFSFAKENEVLSEVIVILREKAEEVKKKQ